MMGDVVLVCVDWWFVFVACVIVLRFLIVHGDG